MIVSVDDPVPTVGGILVLGRQPQDFLPGAYAQFLRVGGTEFGDPVTDAEVCRGAISDVVRRLDDKLIAHNRTSVDFLSGPVEIRDSTYPLEAVKQLVRNAVMHRTYEDTNAPHPRLLVRRSHRDQQPRRSVRRRQRGQLRTARGRRLPQSDPRRGDARARPGAAVRVRHPGRPPAPARRRPSRARVPGRPEPGALHGAGACVTPRRRRRSCRASTATAAATGTTATAGSARRRSTTPSTCC